MLALLFFVTFGAPGRTLKHIFEDGVAICTDWISGILQTQDVSEPVRALVIEGVCAGIGSVLSFLPVIGILFAGLSILQECGYLKFISNLLDPTFRSFGLSGEALAPLLTGFGCSVPAMLAAERMESPGERKLTVFLIPYMSCSAKIPLCAIMCGAMLGERAWMGILIFYATGGLIAAGISLAFRTIRRRRVGDATQEVSRNRRGYYRLKLSCPDFRRVAACTADNMIGFGKKAFTVILLASTVIWTLENFDAEFNLVANPEHSILANLGKLAAPLFAPLGLGDWRIVTALLSGLSAKEAVLSTITVLAYPAEGDVAGMVNGIFTPVTAATFLVFYLLYAPCIASLAAVRKVTGGWRYALAMACAQTLLAWTAAFIVYQTGHFLGF